MLAISEDAGAAIVFGTVVLTVIICVLIANWRWRADRKDELKNESEMIQKGYSQKLLPTSYEKMWVKEDEKTAD